MNDSLTLLLEQVTELEGLLLVAKSHGSDTAEHVYDLIHRKAAQIAAMASTVQSEPIVESEHSEYSEISEPAPAEAPESTESSESSEFSEPEAPFDPTEPLEDDDELYEEDDDDDYPITLDEALQRNMSRDLHKAFSLNDRFRYRRELFSNSDVEMNDTLNLVETMHSYAEAEDFFYGDLEWDKESPEVIDFMNVIRNHFYNHK